MSKSVNEARRGGPRSGATLLPKITRSAFGKRGFVEAGVLTDWPEIVGSVLAAETRPMKLSFPRSTRSNGTLQIRVTGAYSTVLQHLAPLVIERINRYFGYGAVARLTLSQGPVISPPRTKRNKMLDPDPEALERLETCVTTSEDKELRLALAGVGRDVASRQATRNFARRPA